MAQIFRNDQGAAFRQWQNWANLVLAVWLFISAWILGFAASGAAPGATAVPITTGYTAAWNAWIFGVITAVVALWAMSQAAPWQKWLSLAIGIWVFVAPWVLAFSSTLNPAWDHWIVGALIFLVSLSALAYAWKPTVGYAHAGDKPRDRP
jgi:hypothetical protein